MLLIIQSVLLAINTAIMVQDHFTPVSVGCFTVVFLLWLRQFTFDLKKENAKE